MNIALLTKKFSDIGARIKINDPKSRNRRNSGSFLIDVQKDSEGEYFDIRIQEEIEALILDAQKKDRHLLLMARIPDNPKAKFLCGHDERHWFSAAIPESRPATTVIQAKQALKPVELIDLEVKGGIKVKNAQKRRRKLASGIKIVRQGEFNFVPDPKHIPPKDAIIFRNEPMRGGGTNFHWAEFLYRTGGTVVYTRIGPRLLLAKEKKLPSLLSLSEYNNLTREDKTRYRSMVRDATVYVKGRISHKEHATVHLGGIWHKVLINTEAQSKARANSVFLD